MTYNAYGLTEEQQLVRESVLALLDGVLPDKEIDRLENEHQFPKTAYQALAAQGWLGMPYEERWGGAAANHRDLVNFIEATGYHHAGITTAYMTTVIYAGMYIQRHGTQAQQAEFLPRIISGECRMAVAYTEPGAGSDAAAITTRAVREGDDYVLNGQKVYITNAHVADYLVVSVKTTPSAGHKGISLMIVDTRSPGVTIRPMRAMGRATAAPNEVFLDDVRVPSAHLLGEESGGWHMLMQALNLERVLLSAASCGQCQKILEIAKTWANDRVAFGKPIAQQQAVAHMLADMRILTESARLHTYQTAMLLDDRRNAMMETAICKVVATEANIKVADLGVQIMGGAGYVEGPMSRLFRDARIGSIGGGTSQIMRNVIAKGMMSE